MAMALERAVDVTDPFTLLAPDVADRLTRRITTDHPEISATTARRIVGQTAAFVATSGRQPGQTLAPSQLVDYGWHAFILHRWASSPARMNHGVPIPSRRLPAAGRRPRSGSGRA
ncbi:hypothetical protein OHB05_38780 [Streptomyces sp. NBC_00638]|uniref:hypothetical protein n=1 Tax=Streptomyces sp. NBC_00638 TaxID=2975794 RepID=UPI0022549FD8|nr:hypothetical protein [Streptomyces sp. NBC_00638]MCX5008511.1 hypothetical protein [Streptomyces sp. NBC_00638]